MTFNFFLSVFLIEDVEKTHLPPFQLILIVNLAVGNCSDIVTKEEENVELLFPLSLGKYELFLDGIHRRMLRRVW